MAYDRYPNDDWRNRESDEYGRDFGYSYSQGRSSARDYAAAGEYGRGREFRSPRGDRDTRWDRDGDRFANRSYGREQDSGWRDRGFNEGRRGWEPRAGNERRPDGYSPQDRGFLDRAGDEVRSWFGDEEAERRRLLDARYDARHDSDDNYRGWRNRQIADLDRDYDEYRRESQQRFHNEFGAWRTERQNQRGSLSRVTEHMEVVGSDGQHVGTVDKVRGDRIVLTRNDADADGHHHSIPSRWIETVDERVTIRKTADEAKAAWRDEDRSGALFGEQGERSGTYYPGRTFSGTY
jgi:hypothetical protein